MTFRRNPEFIDALRARAKARLLPAAEIIRDKTVALIEEPKSGEHWPGMPRRSSAEGESPASQSGELAGSIALSEPREDSASVSIAVGSPLVKARMLEGGTQGKSPRPFLYPSLVQSRDAVMKTIGGGNG